MYRPPILIITCLSMVAIVFVWQQDIATAALVLFTVIGLGLLSVADLEGGKIPNRLVYPFAGFTWAGVMALAVASGDGPRLVQAVGVTVLYTSVFSVLWFLGHLGAGDVKLLFAVLVVAGWLGVVPAMFWVVGSWLPTLIHALVIKLKQQQSYGFPQAQYFSIGFVLTVFLSQYLEQL